MNNETTDPLDLWKTANTFNWIEYTTFSSLLGLSALIGIYYGCVKGDHNAKEEYMLGGKSMHWFPISMSLLTSHISGVTLLGVPAETYEFGTQYAAICISTIFIVYVTNKFYVPVFYTLQLNSMYEYLELRFSKSVRSIASLIFALSVVLFAPVVIYIPALAFNQVTGVSIHHLAPIICSLCIFYTSIGGLKAVVWSDAIQGIFTLGAIIIVIILGVLDIGSVQKVIDINEAGGRLELFNMNPSPFARNTFWTITIGGFINVLISLAVHPGSSQRFIALPRIQDAKRSVQIFGIGMIVTKILACFIGLIIYAKYENCDPIKGGNITNSGQIIPYYVKHVAADFPGLTGVFISGLISAALSTMSAGLNTVAGTLYEDFFTKCISKKSSSTKANFIMKITVVFLGCVCVIMVYVIEHLKGILQMAVSLGGITGGPIFAVFALGIFWPWANNKGVIWGMVTSVAVMLLIITNSQIAIATNNLTFAKKPTTIRNCTHLGPFFRNETSNNLVEITDGVFANENLPPIFLLSYMYYSMSGALIAIIVGILVSYWTGSTDLETLDPALITPPMRVFLPKTMSKSSKCVNKMKSEYQHVMQELEDFELKKDTLSNGTV